MKNLIRFAELDDERWSDLMGEIKKSMMGFLKEKYNPDKTTIELADLWDFFSITEEDLSNEAEKDASQEKSD